MQLGKDSCIYFVRLHLGMRDDAHLARIGHNDATNMRPQQAYDNRRVAGRLDNDLVTPLERLVKSGD